MGAQDYDRDPVALRTLDAKVWVLSSSLQIMPHKEQGEDEFMKKVKEIITATGRAKSHAVDGSQVADGVVRYHSS